MLSAFTLTGCTTVGYYAQSVTGHLGLMYRARPIETVIAAPDTEPRLTVRLRTALDIREFASDALALPANASYRRYVELDRRFVVWNVVATPELSLAPRQWCFPVAGCLSYRGYFSESAAETYARALEARDWDVTVAGVRAYSTLGWFADPLLSPMVELPEYLLARIVFHELAHQRLYIPGDPELNESFAVVVERAGVDRWIEAAGRAGLTERHRIAAGREAAFLALLRGVRRDLEAVYASSRSDAEKRAAKVKRIERLKARLYRDWDGVVEWMRDLWRGIAAAVDLDALGERLRQGLDWLGIGSGWVDGLVAGIRAVWSTVTGALDLDAVRDWLGGLDLAGLGRSVIGGYVGAVRAVWSTVTGALDLDAVRDWLGGLDLAGLGRSVIGGYVGAVRAVWSTVTGALDLDAVRDWLGGLDLAGLGAAWIGGLLDGLRGAWRGLLGWLGEAIAGLADLLPEWLTDRLGVDTGALRQAVERLAPAPGREAPSLVDAAIRVGGEIRVRFENPPPGMRIVGARTDNPDVPIDVEAGYAMAGTG